MVQFIIYQSTGVRHMAYQGISCLLYTSYNRILPIKFDYTEKILHIWQRGGKWSLNLKEQIYMLSLERHSNITRAAKELGISQPALTTFLNHLEKDLDVKLFDRSAVPMKLTPAGELYINKAKKMLCIKRCV